MTETNETPATATATVATIHKFLELYQLAREVVRVREAEQARAADLERVQESVRHNNEELRRLRAKAGAGASAAVTSHERLLLARLNTTIHRSLTRGLSALLAGRAAEKDLGEYDRAIADSQWVWNILIDRVHNHVDNCTLTDNFVLPGEIVTVVEQVDPSGRPLKLSRYGVMP